MWTVSIFKALVMVARAAPLLVLRALVLAAITGVVGILIYAGAWTGQRFGLAGGLLTPQVGAGLGGLVGLAFGLGLVFLRRDRLMALIHLGPVALLTDGLDRRPVAFSLRQGAETGREVSTRFGHRRDMLALDRLVHGVTGLIPALSDGLGPLFTLPGMGRIAVGRLVDQVVLAQAYRTRTENAWEVAHDGLVLVMQNANPVYAMAGRITLIGWLFTAAVFFGLLGPMSGLAPLWPTAGWSGSVVPAALIAWTIRAALFEPVGFACLMQAFLRISAGQDPLPEWRGRLTQLCESFRQLGERAVTWLPDDQAQA